MDKTKLQPLKGFRDFLPEEVRLRRFAIDKISETFEKYGFEPLETPALEYQELLLGKYGEEADRLVYTFEDKGGRAVALRYDQTVPTARVLAMYQNSLPMPFRRYQIQPVWRAEKPQGGRFREFLQCDADIFGTTSYTADAELIALANGLFTALGFTNFTLFLNDRNILFDLMDYVNVPENLRFPTIQAIDKLDRLSQDQVSQELLTKGLDESAVKHLFDHLLSAKPTDTLAKVIEFANYLGVPKERLQFQAGLARGLDYYTSTIFEVKIADYTEGSVLGGGRYDKLIGQLSGVDIPAVGFAVGFDRTIEAMRALKLFPSDSRRNLALVAIFNSELVAKSAELIKALREANIDVEIYPSTEAKLDKQLKYADKKGVRWFLIIGPDEAQKGTVIVKDLKTGDQEDLQLSSLITKLRET